MTTSLQNQRSRRTVLKSLGATTALTASGLLPSLICASPSAFANDKLRVGLIGAGNRAKWLTRALARESHRAKLVAVCDCYLLQIDALAADNKDDRKAVAAWKRYQNYEQMLEQEELDAVIIATPDHVRVRATILACAKGPRVFPSQCLDTGLPMLSGTLNRADRSSARRCFASIVFVAISFWCGSSLADDWTTLFDGKNLDGWLPSRDNTQFAIVDGIIVGTSSSQTQFLHTVEMYDDFELELEVKLHDTDLNSGIQIRTRLTRNKSDGKPRESIHGPQVDIGKSPGRSGHIFNQGNGAWITPKEDLIRNETITNGEWNKLQVLAVGPRIQTWINGEQVADVTDDEAYAQYPTGVIALQVHGVKRLPEKARRVSFRNIRIRRIESSK